MTILSSKPFNVSCKGLHPRNIHRAGYDFVALSKSYPPLSDKLLLNAYGNITIDYADAGAVKCLNTALLQCDYSIQQWNIPEGFLCPPIPGRADYIHNVADLLSIKQDDKASFRLLDVGTGANGVYALLASQVYGATCVASDIDPAAVANVESILSRNPSLAGKITLRLQSEKSKMFTNIVQRNEYFDVTVCNPPFHSSLEEALKANIQKRKNLITSQKQTALKGEAKLNFGGQKAELWCKGGEQKFIRMMIKESKFFAEQCGWFTTLISKAENIAPAQKLLRKQAAKDIQVIPMHQGNKITRILAWRYSS